MRWMRWEYFVQKGESKGKTIPNKLRFLLFFEKNRWVVSTEVFSLWDHRTVFTLGSGDFAKSQPYNESLPSECAIHPQVDAAKRSRSGRLWDCKESHIVNESLVARRALASLVLTHAELRASPCAVKDRVFFSGSSKDNRLWITDANWAYCLCHGMPQYPWQFDKCWSDLHLFPAAICNSQDPNLEPFQGDQRTLQKAMMSHTIQRRIASLLRRVFFTLSVRAKKVNR